MSEWWDARKPGRRDFPTPLYYRNGRSVISGLLARQWGRIGTQGSARLDPQLDVGAAINALARLARTKRRRGYQDSPA